MKYGIYAEIEAAKNNVIKHEVILNNLANLYTTGFREQYFSLVSENKKNGMVDNDDRCLKTVLNYSNKPGNIVITNRSLDIAPLQNYWITLKNPRSNREMYTRNGRMNLNRNRYLTINDYLVLGEKGKIYIPEYDNIFFLEDGTITSTLKGKKSYLGKLKLTKITKEVLTKNNFNSCYDINNNIVVKNVDQSYKSNDLKKIASNSLENSNVDVAKNLLDSISCCRKFELYTSIISHEIENENLENKFVDASS